MNLTLILRRDKNGRWWMSANEYDRRKLGQTKTVEIPPVIAESLESLWVSAVDNQQLLC
jgi:hypothetical protein